MREHVEELFLQLVAHKSELEYGDIGAEQGGPDAVRVLTADPQVRALLIVPPHYRSPEIGEDALRPVHVRYSYPTCAMQIEVGHSGLFDQPALIDDHDVIGSCSNLMQQ